MGKDKNQIAVINTDVVRSSMIVLRGRPVLLDRDVAELYGVQTKEVNQAVKNNPDKFTEGFLFQLNAEEIISLRSKILTLNAGGGRGRHSKYGYKAFTERGLYMLATILKGGIGDAGDSCDRQCLCPAAIHGAGYGSLADIERRELRTVCTTFESRAQVGGAHRRQPFDRVYKDDN